MEGFYLFFRTWIFSPFGLMILLALAVIFLPKLWTWFNDGLRKCR